MVKKLQPDNELTYKIIGILYKIHNKLGPYHKEKTYQKAIEKELASQNIRFKKEGLVKIEYEDSEIGKYFIDFVIENSVVLETKTLNEVHPKFYNQILSYMKQLQIPLGLIVNFRAKRLWVKRLILPRKYIRQIKTSA